VLGRGVWFALPWTWPQSLSAAVGALLGGDAGGLVAAAPLLGAAAALLAMFLAIEARVAAPLVPLGLFRLRNLATANVVGVLWAAAMFAWFFISALYMQLVLNYSALQVGLAFLPANLIMAAFSLGLSARIVMRFGLRLPLSGGLALVAIGLGLFSLAPVHGSFALHVLPGMLILGLGCGIALNPVLLAAMSDVAPTESGLASGVVNTAFSMGGALGLAVLASLAASRTENLVSSGIERSAALNGGYQLAFLLGAAFAGLAALLSGALLRPKLQAQPAVANA
jgi:MFS family permease